MNVELVAGIELPVPVVLVVGGIWFAVLVVFCAVRTVKTQQKYLSSFVSFVVLPRIISLSPIRPFRNRQEHRGVLPENSHVLCACNFRISAKKGETKRGDSRKSHPCRVIHYVDTYTYSYVHTYMFMCRHTYLFLHTYHTYITVRSILGEKIWTSAAVRHLITYPNNKGNP